MAGQPPRHYEHTSNHKSDTTRIRRQHSAQDKVRLLRLHLVEGRPISAICDQHQIHPTLFYQWQKTFFENGAAAFERSPGRPAKADMGALKIEQLQARLKKKDEVIAALTEELVRTKKRAWGGLKEVWTPPDERDAVVDFLNRMNSLTDIGFGRLLRWCELCPRKFARWRDRYGLANEPNAQVPRDHWLEGWERQAIIRYAQAHPLEGYRSLTYMMMDADVAAVAPSTTYRVLKGAGLIGRATGKPSKKGTGFVQPLVPHEHWHIDFSYINIGGTFYFLCAVLDGCSRMIVAWDIRPTMREIDSEIVLQKAREACPNARPRIISDQGAQFKSREFKAFITQWQASHVMTSPYYPQSNGKLERFHQTLKDQAIRPLTPLSLEDAKRITCDFIDYYNTTRLHSAIGFIAPKDRLQGRHEMIHKQRDKKLEEARQRRKLARQPISSEPIPTQLRNLPL